MALLDDISIATIAGYQSGMRRKPFIVEALNSGIYPINEYDKRIDVSTSVEDIILKTIVIDVVLGNGDDTRSEQSIDVNAEFEGIELRGITIEKEVTDISDTSKINTTFDDISLSSIIVNIVIEDTTDTSKLKSSFEGITLDTIVIENIATYDGNVKVDSNFEDIILEII